MRRWGLQAHKAALVRGDLQGHKALLGVVQTEPIARGGPCRQIPAERSLAARGLRPSSSSTRLRFLLASSSARRASVASQPEHANLPATTLTRCVASSAHTSVPAGVPAFALGGAFSRARRW